MKTKNYSSPEEQLLKLIRGNKKNNHPQQNACGVINNRHGWNTKIYRSFFTAKLIPSFSLKKLVLVFLFLACVYLLSSLAYPFVSLGRLKVPVVMKENVELSQVQDKEENKPYEHYLSAMQGKKIFVSAENLASERVQIATAGSLDIKDITLTGIISGDNPQAVVEDKKNQKTYYFNKGQLFGDIQVEDIQEGKIILKQNNQLYELYL
ncbi:MAG: hypothetical protein HY761_07970 [Candidatus Omnitrophica bacterium]|nr:hypothetical protein [Candidatus Omnitrophota bacterium]